MHTSTTSLKKKIYEVVGHYSDAPDPLSGDNASRVTKQSQSGGNTQLLHLAISNIIHIITTTTKKKQYSHLKIKLLIIIDNLVSLRKEQQATCPYDQIA